MNTAFPTTESLTHGQPPTENVGGCDALPLVSIGPDGIGGELQHDGTGTPVDAAAVRDRAPDRVDLTRAQIDAGESFGGLLKGLREERGLTVDDLAGRAFAHAGSFKQMLVSAERAAACCWGPWLADRVWAALVAVKPATQAQAAAWHGFVRRGGAVAVTEVGGGR